MSATYKSAGRAPLRFPHEVCIFWTLMKTFTPRHFELGLYLN